MFTRRFAFRIRADSSAYFTRVVEGQFRPPLRALPAASYLLGVL
jgi:hypothetical protein